MGHGLNRHGINASPCINYVAAKNIRQLKKAFSNLKFDFLLLN